MAVATTTPTLTRAGTMGDTEDRLRGVDSPSGWEEMERGVELIAVSLISILMLAGK